MVRFCVENIRYENFTAILTEADNDGAVGVRRP
jgi:hypothetical protein